VGPKSDGFVRSLATDPLQEGQERQGDLEAENPSEGLELDSLPWRLQAVAEILARGIMRLLAAEGTTVATRAEGLPAVTSGSCTSQVKDALSGDRHAVAFVSAESVHVIQTAQIGVAE